MISTKKITGFEVEGLFYDFTAEVCHQDRKIDWVSINNLEAYAYDGDTITTDKDMWTRVEKAFRHTFPLCTLFPLVY